MSKYVVTWTFMRHVHRQRQYKILTRVIDCEDDFVEFNMLHHKDTKEIINMGYKPKLKSYTNITNL